MLKTRALGCIPYRHVYDQMQNHVKQLPEMANEIWFVEHPPVFTQGKHGSAEHLLNAHGISVIQSDRGGQITYHGPGQAVIYFMLDLKSLSLGVKKLVHLIEQSCIKLLDTYGIAAHLIDKAPGVYVDGKKIASLGLRVKRFKTYHGLAINTDMDLTPFHYINPCGYQGLQMTQISAFKPEITVKQVFEGFHQAFHQKLQETGILV